eukprot:CAMPEP_0175328734 /NCGR_PEP_ID=MMETSP0093-20121207/75702_1 /TAXON_ID=311494 /ORGANISM="Alexandrium monilatum, Strain CCMP3105" /LENGTH=165 /DNA_ID=CAMNT_0016625781 /DNA_START=21 /DNA_END=514 /DNA_ORIENTATION=-
MNAQFKNSALGRSTRCRSGQHALALRHQAQALYTLRGQNLHRSGSAPRSRGSKRKARRRRKWNIRAARAERSECVGRPEDAWPGRNKIREQHRGGGAGAARLCAQPSGEGRRGKAAPAQVRTQMRPPSLQRDLFTFHCNVTHTATGSSDSPYPGATSRPTPVVRV